MTELGRGGNEAARLTITVDADVAGAMRALAAIDAAGRRTGRGIEPQANLVSRSLSRMSRSLQSAFGDWRTQWSNATNQIGQLTSGTMSRIGRSISAMHQQVYHSAMSAYAGVAAAAAAAVPIGAIVVATARNESAQFALNVVFKDQAKAITEAAGAAEQYGINQRDYAYYSALLGQQLNTLGVEQSEILGKTKDLVKTGANLAAVYGGNVEQAIQALSAAFRNELDPIERYGINLKESMIKAEALNLGLLKGVPVASEVATAQARLMRAQERLASVQQDGTASAAELATVNAEVGAATDALDRAVEGHIPQIDNAARAQAAYSLIMKQSANMANAAAEAQGNLEFKFNVFKATVMNAAIAIGDSWKPQMNAVLDLLQSMATYVKEHPALFSKLVTVMGVAAVAVGGFSVMVISLSMALAAVGVLLNPLMIGFVAVNTAMLATGGLFASLVASSPELRERLVKLFTQLRDLLKRIVENEAPRFQAAWDRLKKSMENAANRLIPWIQTHLPALEQKLKKIGSTITNVVVAAMNGLANAFDNPQELANGLIAKLKEVAAAAAGLGLVGAGIAAIQALWPLLAAMFTPVGLAIAAVVVGLGALSAAFMAVYVSSQPVRDAVGEWWDKLRTLFIDLKDIVMPRLSEAWDNLKGAVERTIEKVRPIIEEHWPKLEELTKKVAEAFADLLDAGLREFGLWLEQNGPTLLEGFLNWLKAVLWVLEKLIKVTTAFFDTWNRTPEPLKKVMQHFNGIGYLMNMTELANKLPGMETGGTVLSSGTFMVGEAGPELVTLPRGASVTPNDALGRTGDVNITINGGNLDQVRRTVAAALDQRDRRLGQQLRAVRV